MKMNEDNLENIKGLIVILTPVITVAASLLSMWSGHYSQQKIISKEVSEQLKKLNNQ